MNTLAIVRNLYLLATANMASGEGTSATRVGAMRPTVGPGNAPVVNGRSPQWVMRALGVAMSGLQG